MAPAARGCLLRAGAAHLYDDEPDPRRDSRHRAARGGATRGRDGHDPRQLGYTNGTVNARYAQLEAALQPKGSGDPRPGILADNEKWVRDAEQRAALLFDLRPKAPVVVRREPAFSEKTAAAHYTNPAPDGSRPGVFWLPLPGPPYRILRRRSLTYHEAVPGHHFQLALQQEMTDLPRFRSRGAIGAGSAFVEGWALYAERLADENGWYERRSAWPPGVSEQHAVPRPPACGRHGHSRQAVDAAAGNRLRHQRAGGRTLRRVAGPGVRVHDRTAPDRRAPRQGAGGHGPRFQIKEFHNLVLRTGDVPLDVLGREVDAWVAQ